MRLFARKTRGVVALVSVLIVMAVVLAVGLTISLVGRDEIVLSGIFQDGEQAFAIADACVEEGVDQLGLNFAYAGGGFPLDGGTCTIAVANLGGNTRLITGTGVYNNNTRIIQANVSIRFNTSGNAEKVTINSWQEAN